MSFIIPTLVATFFLMAMYSYAQTKSIASASDSRSNFGDVTGQRRTNLDLIEGRSGDDWFEDGAIDCEDDLQTKLGDDLFGSFAHTDDSGCGHEDDDVFRFNLDDISGFVATDDLWKEDDYVDSTSLDDDEPFEFEAFDLTSTLVEAEESEIPTDSNTFDGFEVTDIDDTTSSGTEASSLLNDMRNLFGAGESDSGFEIDESQLQGRIVGGTIAGDRRYPYLVSLLNVKPTASGNKVYHACGGALIAPDVVLSAAHCVTSSLRYAQIGKFHMHSSRNRPNSVETKVVETILVHPGWTRRTFVNDLALIKLDSKTVRTSNVIEIQTQEVMVDGEPLQIMGWGKTRVGSRLSAYIRHVSVNYMTNEKCRSPLYGYGNVIKDRMMCANNGPADACQGDSGGPMVRQNQADLENPQKDLLVGVVSWGFGCSFARYPGVYARLDVDWIEESICNPFSGLSFESCAGPNKLYASSSLYDAPSEESVTDEEIASETYANVPTNDQVCKDKTTILASDNIQNLDCKKVGDFYWILCFYHRDDCPEKCCPRSCDIETGKCSGDRSSLRDTQRGRIREHRPIEDSDST